MNEATSVPSDPSPVGVPKPLWVVEIWHAVRPYVIKVSVDFSVFIIIWLLLLTAHWMTTTFPLGGSLAQFIVGFHQTVVVLSFVWLSMVALWDLVRLKRR